MIDNFHIITLTHQTINVDQIGHFVVKHQSKAELKDKLTEVKANFDINEIVYLSTCNRVSYILYREEELEDDFLQNFFHSINAALSDDRLNKLSKFVRLHSGMKAINHLFELSASIDSLVVGEREIFRQYREAYSQSVEWQLAGDHLRMLDKYTVTTAKEIYANTKIGEKPLSVVSLAIKRMLSLNPDPSQRVLLVGAGETNRLVGKFLKKYDFANITIFNRSLDNAQELSNILNAKAFHISELATYDRGFDILVVCTGSTESIISTDIYSQLIRRDESKKIVIDLSVPHNVDESVQSGFDMDYVNIEQLRTLAEKNLEHRKNEIGSAKKIIKGRLFEFQKVYQQRQIEKAFHKIPQEMKAIKERAVNSVYAKQLDELDDNAKALVLEMMNYMEKKCVSVPMKVAKEI